MKESTEKHKRKARSNANQKEISEESKGVIEGRMVADKKDKWKKGWKVRFNKRKEQREEHRDRNDTKKDEVGSTQGEKCGRQ